MGTTPFVSIICTVFNKEPWLKKTIDSFLAQKTNFTFEIILVDDASSDGSRRIIQDYQANFPDLIRAFYQDENQGIAKTWVTICKEVRGNYIARCDGDDFWLDPLKLQKQVDLLESKPNCKWSNTDFDIYDEKGSFVSKAGFASKTISLADTYEKMLATRGFTMASTWLVDRDLMLEVNKELDLTTSDDTFNLQMELFQRTSLAYLDEATVAYTINQGSDSRPCDFKKLEQRFQKLLQTQLEYLDKYPNADFKEMTKILLERNNTYEIQLSKPTNSLSHIGVEHVTIYFENEEGTFSQATIFQRLLQHEDSILFSLPEQSTKLRIDLSEIPSYYSTVSLIDVDHNTEILPTYSNGFVVNNHYFFPKQDPQLIYEIRNFHGKIFVLHYKMLNVDNLNQTDYIGNILGNELKNLTAKLENQTELKTRLKNIEEENRKLSKDVEDITHQYNSVVHSRRWMIPTKIINIFKKGK